MRRPTGADPIPVGPVPRAQQLVGDQRPQVVHLERQAGRPPPRPTVPAPARPVERDLSGGTRDARRSDLHLQDDALRRRRPTPVPQPSHSSGSAAAHRGHSESRTHNSPRDESPGQSTFRRPPQRALDRTRTCGLPLRRLRHDVQVVRSRALTCTDSGAESTGCAPVRGGRRSLGPA